MYKILKKIQLNNDVYQMRIEAPWVAKNALPGHFLILRVDKEGERVPITIVDHDSDSVDIIVQAIGFSTKKLAMMQVGDSLEDVVGPLGMPAHIHSAKRVLGIAGGVGAAPLFPQLKAYAKSGALVDLVIGGRTKDHLLLLDEYAKFCNKIYMATDDGSAGRKGFVTDVQRELLSNQQYDLSIAIGPLIMMKNCVRVSDEFKVPSYVSLNPIMIDGTGMCGNCRLHINGETRFACVDGPDFPAAGIDFDELIERQKFYREEEHKCMLRLGEK